MFGLAVEYAHRVKAGMDMRGPAGPWGESVQMKRGIIYQVMNLEQKLN